MCACAQAENDPNAALDLLTDRGRRAALQLAVVTQQVRGRGCCRVRRRRARAHAHCCCCCRRVTRVWGCAPLLRTAQQVVEAEDGPQWVRASHVALLKQMGFAEKAARLALASGNHGLTRAVQRLEVCVGVFV
jgi:hypothetical protein